MTDPLQALATNRETMREHTRAILAESRASVLRFDAAIELAEALVTKFNELMERIDCGR